MNIPVELVFSSIKGGHFESTGPRSGQWWRSGKLIAEWRTGRDGKAIVTWHIKRESNIG